MVVVLLMGVKVVVGMLVLLVYVFVSVPRIMCPMRFHIKQIAYHIRPVSLISHRIRIILRFVGALV